MTDALSYNRTIFLIQNYSSSEGFVWIRKMSDLRTVNCMSNHSLSHSWDFVPEGRKVGGVVGDHLVCGLP
jgi:hypothetical protein